MIKNGHFTYELCENTGHIKRIGPSLKLGEATYSYHATPEEARARYKEVVDSRPDEPEDSSVTSHKYKLCEIRGTITKAYGLPITLIKDDFGHSYHDSEEDAKRRYKQVLVSRRDVVKSALELAEAELSKFMELD